MAAAVATTTTLLVSPASPTLADHITVSVTVTPAPSAPPSPCGVIDIYETTTGTREPRGTGASWCGEFPAASYTYDINVFPVGSHTFLATFTSADLTAYSSSESAPVTFTIGKAPTMTRLFEAWSTPPETNNSFRIRAFLNSDLPSTGTVAFWRVGAASPTCTGLIAQNNEVFCTVPALPKGTYGFKAVFSGTATLQASESSVLSVTVGADTVHASGVGLQYSTFYPVSDAYKDTVAIRGTRDELSAVTIRIYNSSNTLLKTVSIAQGTGAYSYAWNGRKSDGTIRPEGTYRVVQTIVDAFGTSKAFTNSVVLSKKKIYTYTRTISKLGSSNTAEGGWPPNVVISKNYTAGYVKLAIPSGTTGWVGVGWQFTLPTATLYKSFYVRIYGRHSGSVGVTQLGAQNFALGGCGYSSSTDWDLGCFGSWANIPTTSGTTLHYYRTANLATSFRSGAKVRLSVSTTGGTTYVYKAQVVVTYGILKY